MDRGASSAPTQRAAHEDRRPSRDLPSCSPGFLSGPLPMPFHLLPVHYPPSSDFFSCSKSKIVCCLNTFLMASGIFHRKSDIIYKITNKWRVERNPCSKRPSVNLCHCGSLIFHSQSSDNCFCLIWFYLD